VNEYITAALQGLLPHIGKLRHAAARIGAATILPVLLSLTVPVALVRAQGWAGSDAKSEPRTLIDVPTAGMLRGGETAFRVDFFRSDGLQTAFNYAVLDRLMFGISYGGSHIIGTEPVEWNEVPGFLVKVRVFEEGGSLPALVLGFESEGGGEYLGDADRFTIKSPGLYVVLSKNYNTSGFLGFHGGLNYSLEKADGDKDLNAFFGIDKTLGSFLSVVAEYNAGFNDNGPKSLGRGRGYLDAGLAASPGGGITLSVHFKDLLGNQVHRGFANRTLRIDYAR